MRAIFVSVALLLISIGQLQAETTAIFVSVYTPDPSDSNSCKVTISSGARNELKSNLSIEAAAQILKSTPGSGSVIWVYMRSDGCFMGMLKPLFDAILSNAVMELRYFHNDTDPIHAEEALQKAIPQGR